MNILTVKSFFEGLYQGDERKECSFGAYVDGKSILQCLDPVELELSLRKDGVFDILICGCTGTRGNGCDDYSILVHHQDEKICWEKAKHSIMDGVTQHLESKMWSEQFRGWVDGPMINLPLVFLRKDLEKLIAEMRVFLEEHGELEDHEERLYRIGAACERNGSRGLELD